MSQAFAPVREQLKKHGVRFGTNLVVKSNPKPYIHAEIFFDDIRTVFGAHLTEFLRFDELSEEMAV
jgi:hypothetical protein